MNNNNEVIGKQSKFGRPSKEESEKRSNPVKLSFTSAELDFIKKTADDSGYKQVSRYLNDLILNGLKDKTMATQVVPEINHKLVNILSGVSNNVNQAVRILNSLKGGRTEHWNHLQNLLKTVIELSSAAIHFSIGRKEQGDEILKSLDGEVVEAHKNFISFRSEDWMSDEIFEHLFEATTRLNVLSGFDSILKGEEIPDIPAFQEQLRKNEMILMVAISYFRGSKEYGDELFEGMRKEFYHGNS